MGKLFFGTLATFAELEADLIAERTRERLAALKAQGKPVGKPKKLTERQEIALFHAVEAGMTMTELASRYKVSRSTIRRGVERETLKRQLKTDPELRREEKVMRLERKQVEAELDKALADSAEAK